MQRPSYMLVREQWRHGYVWHMHTHNHTPTLPRFPQAAVLSLQEEDWPRHRLTQMSKWDNAALWPSWWGFWQRCSPCVALIDKRANSQFNPPRLLERLLNDQVVEHLNLSSSSLGKRFAGSKEVLHFNVLQFLVFGRWGACWEFFYCSKVDVKMLINAQFWKLPIEFAQ